MTVRGPLRRVTATTPAGTGRFTHELECGHDVIRYRRYDDGPDIPYRCRCDICALEQALEATSQMFDVLKFKPVNLRTAPRRQIVRRRTRAYRDGGGRALTLLCGHVRHVLPSKEPKGQYSRCGQCKGE